MEKQFAAFAAILGIVVSVGILATEIMA